ncbi:C4-dicarboxylate ABC transporter substrate-binding protein [candidate division KSB1 bacterium]|nr:MAG: C4-dicarboxylate ABC transporter substrate-binding protein [candidate division KSB1 bacterium]
MMNWKGIVFFLLCLPLIVSAQVIKIGSIAPDRSPWNDALKEIAREWEKITSGQVKLKIYPGGITGSEDDMIRKMKLGVLGGAVLTNVGITKINRDAFVLNSPFLFDSEKEMEYVMGQLVPIFEKQIRERGYHTVVWVMSGWINFFSKDPVIYPSDLKKQKLAISTDEPEVELAWKKSGFRTVPIELKDMMMALQSGMIEAFYIPPVLAGAGQYFAFAPHMNSLKITPLVGGMVIVNRIWDKIPEGFKPAMKAAVQKVQAKLDKGIIDLEADALATMKKNGLIFHEAPPDSLPRWKEGAIKGMDELVGKVFSKEIYDKLLGMLKEYRQKNVQ